MGPPAKPPRRRAATPEPSSPFGIHDEATLHESPASPELFDRPEQRPTPAALPHLSTKDFDVPPVRGEATEDALGVETIMTPSGGAERRAWQDVASAASAPARARFGGSADEDHSHPLIDVATDPELASQDGIDATRPIPTVDDRTELGEQRVPVSVRRAAPKPRPELPPFEPPARPRAEGPHGTRKLPTVEPKRPPASEPVNPPAPRTPDTRAPPPKSKAQRATTRTRSLASLDDDLFLDEPPNEPTRLGELAGPEPFTAPPRRPDPMAEAPVHRAPRGPVPQAETIAAPGELAGLIEDLEARAMPEVGGGPPKPPHPAPEPAVRSPSTVRRGLESRLPPSDTPILSTSAPDLSPMEPAPLFETAEDLDALEVDPAAVAPLEATRALVEEYDDGQLSMPGDPSPLGVTEPRPLSPRDDTGPMPTAAPLISSRGETANETPEVRWKLATRGRRFFSSALDALVLLGVIAVPALLGLFGAEVAEASPIEPDDVSRLLTQGHLTIPIVLGLGLMTFYVALGTSLGGRSIGKLAFGLQVVRTASGGPPGFGRSLVRAGFALFGLLLGGIGPLWTLVDGECRALHDKWSGTTVVRSGSKEEITGAGASAPAG